ncbi:MAG: hypothetical protein Q8K32_22825 [Archangium sp.]|nr:hypothetical protein [Archangium sp.]
MRRAVLLSVFGLLCACPGPVVNPPADKCAGVRCTGSDLCNSQTGQCAAAPVDGGRDAGLDAGSSDAGTDAGVDAGFDGGVDAGVDAGLDAGTDAGLDAGQDAGEVDAGCASDQECFGVQHCEPSTRTCVDCYLDAHCPSSAVPVCDVRTSMCVGCVATADCLNPTPICDAQQCLPCSTSAECGPGRECNLGSGECNALNDTCASARVILPSGTGTSSISSEPGQGIDDTAGTCNAAGAELVYTFTTTTVQSLTVSVAPSSGSLARPVVFLRSGCTGTQLGCDAPVSGSAGLSIASLPVGTYFLFVESANGAPGRVSLTVSLQPPSTSSSNDTCASATALTVNGSSVTRSVVVGNTLIATNDNTTEPSCSATARSAGPDLVYSYTLNARSNVTVVARPISGSALHPVVSIRTPCLAPNVESACQAGSAAVAVQASVPGQLPGTYFVTVDSADGTTGAFQLEIDANPTVDNDTCAAPTQLTFSGSSATGLGDTTWATNGNVLGDLTPSCSDSARGTGRDVVFSYTLTAAQDVTISVTPTGASPTFKPVVSVRAATCGDASRAGERGCVSPLAPTEGRLSLINQPAGTYFVWVDSAADTSGPFQLEVVTAPPTPPPANDSCTAPELLTFTGDVATVSGSTLQAANDNYAGDVSPTCSPSAKQSGRDVVYQFTLTQPQDVSLSLTPASGSPLIPALYVRRTNCTSQLLSDEVVCLNQVGGVATQQTNLAAGTYFVFVDSSGGTSGAFTLTVTRSAPTAAPANDDCAGAQSLSFTNNVATVSGTTFGASNSNAPTHNAPACGTDFIPRRFGRDLVYSYTLSGAQDVDVTVTPATGSALVPTLYVRSPNMCTSFSAGSELACVAESTSRPLRIYLPNQVAGTYFLFVDSNSYATGAFTLSVTKRTATVPPANDTCAAPTAVLAGPTGVTGDTSGATDNYSALTYSAACRRSFFDARDLVYQYTATATGTVTATVSPEATFDAALLLLQPTCGAAQCVRFADAAGAGVPESFAFSVTQGQTYFLVVDGWNREMPNTFGRFTLTVQP